MLAKSVSIVIVDDNDIDIEAIKRALRKCQIDNPVFTASDGAEALELLRKSPEEGGVKRPYLILLDLNMPYMDGFEFLGELRLDPDLRSSVVFVLTSSSNEEDKVASYSHNVAGYIVKQAAGDALLQAVKMLDSYWSVIEFPPARAS
jgi:CheY-like chemotaxis protein